MNRIPREEISSLLDHAETLAELVQFHFVEGSWQHRLANEFIERISDYKEGH